MAIYSAVPPPPEHTDTANTNATVASNVQVTNDSIDIEAWTVSALQSLNVSPTVRGTPLTIPIDEAAVAKKAGARNVTFTGSAQTPPQRPLSRRDSQQKREAVLKGKEGSRQRRRWENGTDMPPSAPVQSCGVNR